MSQTDEQSSMLPGHSPPPVTVSPAESTAIAKRLALASVGMPVVPSRMAVEALPFDGDFSRIASLLGGAAARARLHALHPARPGDEGAATGFAFALLDRVLDPQYRGASGRLSPRPVLWVQDRSARLESGHPYGPGFGAFGLDAGQLVIVLAKGALEALAAAEIGLEIGGLAGVLVELPPQVPADMLTLGKRLVLRSERSRTPCLLLHASARFVSAPVATRWQIASLPAVSEQPWGAPVARAEATLVKNRFGPEGRWSVPLAHPSSVPGVSPGVSDVSASGFPASLPQSLDAQPADRQGAAVRRAA